MKFLVALSLLISANAFAAEKRAPLEPETKVSISVFDLVKRRGKTPMSAANGLQRKYVEDVLDLIRGQKEKILECLGESSKMTVQFRVEIEPRGAGNAYAVNSDTAASACLSAILTDLPYPAHKLASRVEIEFPLELERRSF